MVFAFMIIKDKNGPLKNNSNNSKIYLKNVNLSIGNNVISYVPLDDRPVNVDRVQYLASIAGYELAMPNKDYYSSYSDNLKGNPKKIAEFLNKQEKEGCDYYIISLDQLFSGGLMASRAYTDEEFEDGTMDAAMSALEKILDDKNNKVYLFDTALRLATSSNYNNFDMNDYNFSRMYFAAPRTKLADKDLTIENIVKSYTNPSSNKYTITENVVNGMNMVNSNNKSISKTKFNKILKIRERKLRLVDKYTKLFENMKADTYYLVGMDDSVEDENSVQYNEMRYIEKITQNYSKINKKYSNKQFKLTSSTDEAGMLLLTRLVVETTGVNMNINIEYFTDKNKTGSDYEFKSMDSVIGQFIETVGVYRGTSSKDSSLDILVYSYDPDKSIEENKENYYKMINKYKENIENNRPTVIIDNPEKIKDKELKYINLDLVNGTPIGYLLGYSDWNTMANASGIALSQGIVRYLYLASDEQSEEADFAFLKSIVFDFVKDLGYKRYTLDYAKDKLPYDLRDESGKTSIKYINLLNDYMTNDNISHVPTIIQSFKNSNYVTDIDKDGKFVVKGIADIELNNFYFPWNRNFEINFDMKISVKDSKNELIIDEKYNQSEENTNNINIDEEKKEELMSKNQEDTANSNVISSDDITLMSDEEELKTQENNDNKNQKKKYKQTVTHYAYIDVKNGSFDLNGTITRAEFAKWICRANNISPVNKYNSPYNDVNRSTTYWQYIIAATNEGYLEGNENYKYRPTSLLTRAEAVTALLRVSKLNGIVYSKNCGYPLMKDVSSTEWYYDPMRTASYYCIIEGDDKGLFKPKANVTKAELSAMMYRTLLRNHDGYDCDLPSTNPFSNIKTDHWAYKYLLDASKTHTCKK